jgi:hypothetical protein
MFGTTWQASSWIRIRTPYADPGGKLNADPNLDMKHWKQNRPSQFSMTVMRKYVPYLTWRLPSPWAQVTTLATAPYCPDEDDDNPATELSPLNYFTPLVVICKINTEGWEHSNRGYSRGRQHYETMIMTAEVIQITNGICREKYEGRRKET